MSTLLQLNDAQIKQVLDDYFAPSGKRSKMTKEELLELSKKLNKKIDIPLINETREEKIIFKIVIKVDTFLYDNLPNEFYDLIHSVRDGIDDNEAKRLIKRLSKIANEKIDIPYVPEAIEYIAIRFVIGVLINAARKGWDFHKAQHSSDKMLVPTDPNPRDADFDAMISHGV